MQLKSFVPLILRKWLRTKYNTIWIARAYNSWPFGLWWSLFHHTYRTENMEFALPLEKMPIGFRSRFLFDAYEREERILCRKYIQGEDRVLELGGCIGIVSCICNLRLNDRTKHIVVEANPDLIIWIEKNRSRNDAQFSIEHGMLSRTSDGTFRIEDFIVSGSANTSSGKSVSVPVFCIEKVLQKHHFTPTAIIMDIEGGEIDFIQENQSWLSRNPDVRTIITEVHPLIIGEEAIETLHNTLHLLGFICKETVGSVECWKR